MDLIALLKESLLILRKEPRLFAPKMLLAALYGFGMIVVAELSLETLLPLVYGEPSRQAIMAMAAYFPLILLMLLYTVLIFLVDVLVNAMYPVMIRDFKKGKKISFSSAFEFAAKKFPVVLPAMLTVFAIDVVIAIPFSLVFTALILSRNIIGIWLSLLLFLVLSFVFILLFYVIYPVAVLKEKNFIAAIAGTVKIGLSNLKELSIPAIIPFLLSAINFGLAFYTRNPSILVIFILLRFVMAIIATYHMVLNPTVYFALRGKIK